MSELREEEFMDLSKIPVRLLIFAALVIFISVANATDSQGVLIISTEHAGLSIFVDGEQIGETPLKSDSVCLNAGDHLVTVYDSGSRDWLGAAFHYSVSILADSVSLLNIDLNEHVWIVSQPSHAKLSFQDQLIGRTPMNVIRSDWGMQKLTVHKKGFLSRSLSQPPVGQRQLHVKLTPVHSQASKPAGPGAGEIFKSRSVLLTGAIALGGGIAGYVFKRLAENSYDRYLVAGHPSDMDTYYDRAILFDRISGLCYVTCEINFCAALFFSIRKAGSR